MHADSSSPIAVHAGPSRKWYLLAVALIVAGAGLFLWATSRANERFIEVFANMQRVVMPGEHTLTLDEPGQYEVYYERRSEIDGRSFETAKQPPPLKLSVQRQGGDAIKVEPAKELGVYDRGKYQGTGVWRFSIEHAGQYVLTGTYEADARRTPTIALAIDNGQLKATYQQVMGLPFTVAGLFGVAALLIVLITFAARLQAKARAAEAGGS
jgi:hypothetical protein